MCEFLSYLIVPKRQVCINASEDLVCINARADSVCIKTRAASVCIKTGAASVCIKTRAASVTDAMRVRISLSCNGPLSQVFIAGAVCY